ncbi:S8 family serine peptidase [Streptomyces ipomoeae]|uniref:S8 family serine peptidase n=1 Tax=Streptomyces ipomoeae TaxID=103232 RepID=UPI001146E821|nr:S8 family serine peptidase [Streptomyces ipomoeae]MDX2932399.1 S8 family serine peptidase [Streptomyces ipomoeae]TQE27087.1 protease-associated PA domain-containing protein [Streptomyces ipomoeae]
MTLHHIRPRAAVTLLTPLLAGALTLTAVTAPVFAADAGSAESGASGASGSNENFGPGTYVVKLADAPVAAYEGGLPRLKRTASTAGRRLDTDSAAVKDYLEHLDTRRDKVLDAVPGVRPLYRYDYTFNGFAAELTAKQARTLADQPGVVSLTRSTVSHLTSDAPAPDHGPGVGAAGRADAGTGTGADAGAGSGAGAWAGADNRAPQPSPSPAPSPSAPDATPAGSATSTEEAAGTAQLPDLPRMLGLSGKNGLWSKVGGPEHAGEGVIVGIVDTGVDPSNPMLAPLPEPRPDAEAIAKKWKGDCDPGTDPAYKVTCNNKVIGAQWFRKGVAEPTADDVSSPMDRDSHGTHTGTTAAGNHGVKASVPGSNAEGVLSGVSPASRLAYYKACWSTGCWDVDTTAAIDRAVADGVDVINYSIGGDIASPPTKEAMFNAAKAGVFVSASSGNGGPDTVGHTAPWVTTVAASSHDTGYTGSMVLGNGRTFTHRNMNPGVASAPLVNAVDVRKADADREQAAFCAPGTLDPAKTRDKIVVCDRGGDGVFLTTKADEVAAAGGKAFVLAHTPTSGQDFIAYVYRVPMFQVSPEEAKVVKEYAAGAGATAGFTASRSEPVSTRDVTDFSSSGPDPFSDGDLLKPDIAAPGEAVPAGTVPGTKAGFAGTFGFASGTSMAAPHIAGLAALLKQLHPDWSPMEIKSALMTTATTKDGAGDPIGRQQADSATPIDYGAGTPRVTRAADPGLVYDSTSADWTAYLCAIGLPPAAQDGTDACATAAKLDPSDLNYASISVGDLLGSQTVTRKVTNVSARTSTYRAELQTPAGFKAKVTPASLRLAPGESASYTIRFERTDAAFDTWSFGSLTLSDSYGHKVTSPIALRATRFSAPAEVTVTGEESVKLTPGVGWNGDLTAKASLYTGKKTTGTLTGTDQSRFWESQHTNDAVVKHRVHVPEGAAFTRVAITSADHVPGSDIDLYAFDTAGNHVGRWADVGSDEYADLPPGDYDVYVLQYELPAGTTSQQYTLWTYEVGQGTPAVTPTVTPSTQQVTAGTRPEVTVTWPDAKKGERYVGVVEFGDGETVTGRTPLTVTP